MVAHNFSTLIPKSLVDIISDTDIKSLSEVLKPKYEIQTPKIENIETDFTTEENFVADDEEEDYNLKGDDFYTLGEYTFDVQNIVEENHSTQIPQSPVNISKGDTPTKSADAVLDNINYKSSHIEIFNNGENIDGEFTTEENFVTYHGEDYYLKGLHFHTLSEHTCNGEHSDAEVHLVHQSKSGKRLVLGFLLDGVDADSTQGSLINTALDSFLGQLDESLEDTDLIIEGGNFDPGQLLYPDDQVYKYGGSLTTSPFTDATWIVAAKTLKVDADDLENFSNLQDSFYDNDGFNFRDIQNELFLGTEEDDYLTGDRNGTDGFSDDLIYADDGNDIIESGLGDDKVYGEKGDDIIFAGSGDDLVVGDNDLAGVKSDAFAKDILIGGEGKDTLYISGDDIAVGGGPNFLDNDLVDMLNNNPFESDLDLSDGEQDTFVFVNNGNGYTATIVSFEAGIDKLDLTAYNLGSDSSNSLQDIQQKDGWWEYKISDNNGTEIVLRIDANPDDVNAALV